MESSNYRFEYGNDYINDTLYSMKLDFKTINIFDLPNNDQTVIEICNFGTGRNLRPEQQP